MQKEIFMQEVSWAYQNTFSQGGALFQVVVKHNKNTKHDSSGEVWSMPSQQNWKFSFVIFMRAILCIDCSIRTTDCSIRVS